MKLEIRHDLEWSYTSPVFLYPHLLRLIPRSGGEQVLLDLNIEVTPGPDGRSRVWDGNGNLAEYLWFSGEHTGLSVRVRSTVETHRDNPYDAIAPSQDAWSVPIEYPQDEQFSLMAYRVSPANPDELDEVAFRLDKTDAQAFAADACRWLHGNIEVVRREHGDPLPPSALLRFRKGSCRDFAVAHNDICRRAGIASRFVSGYHCVPADTYDLHAWSEVYLPGAGWRGFDATTGLAAADEHIALAAAPQPSGASPTTGAFRGDAKQDLNYSVEFRILED